MATFVARHSTFTPLGHRIAWIPGGFGTGSPAGGLDIQQIGFSAAGSLDPFLQSRLQLVRTVHLGSGNSVSLGQMGKINIRITQIAEWEDAVLNSVSSVLRSRSDAMMSMLR